MEIDQQPPKFAQEMEIEPKKEKYDAQEDKEMANYNDILMEHEDIKSTRGVEEEAEHRDKYKNKNKGDDTERGNISTRPRSTNILDVQPDIQLPQISTPTNQEAPIDANSVKNGLLTPLNELTPPTNVPKRKKGSLGN